jgi:prepilin-type N-terminal cleavage/methylation domain-containing protein
MRRALLRRGFTLLEVMISLGIFAFVSFLLMEMLARQSRTYTVVDNVAEAQEKVRAVANLLEQDLRVTDFLVPQAGAFCGYDTHPNEPDDDPDVIYVTNTEALTPPPPPPAPQPVAVAPSNSPYERYVATVVPMLPASVGGVALPQSFVVTALQVDAPAFYDLNGDGVGDSDFRGPISAASPPSQRGGVIVFDPADPAKGTACGQITNINLVTNTITVDFTSGGAVPSNAFGTGTPLGAGALTQLALVPAHGYWIQNSPAGVPQLMRDGVVMAEDIEDLQFAAFYDAGDDGIVAALGVAAPPPWHNAAEYPGSADVGSAYRSNAYDNSLLREIRVTIVARTRTIDPDVALNPAFANNFRQRPENRVIPGLAADGFRRRVLTMTIAPRNVLSKR